MQLRTVSNVHDVAFNEFKSKNLQLSRQLKIFPRSKRQPYLIWC